MTIQLIYECAALTFLMGLLARGAGGTNDLGKFPPIMFGLVFGWAATMVGAPAWSMLPLALFTWLASETGHGRFYYMKGANLSKPDDEPERIEKIVLPVWQWLARKNPVNPATRPIYSWVCMGIKGLLIGAAIFPYGLAFGILWPLGYYLGFHVFPNKKGSSPDWFVGCFAGATIAVIYATRDAVVCPTTVFENIDSFVALL